MCESVLINSPKVFTIPPSDKKDDVNRKSVPKYINIRIRGEKISVETT